MPRFDTIKERRFYYRKTEDLYEKDIITAFAMLGFCIAFCLQYGQGVRLARRIITFILVTFAWLFFRANSMADAAVLLNTLVTGWGNTAETFSSMGLSLTAIITTALSILTLVMIDTLLVYEDTDDGSEALTKNGAFIYLIWIILFAWGLLLSKDMMSTFIYFQF